jgi:tellurite resistance protein TerC
MFEGAPIAWWICFHIVVLALILIDLLVLGRGEASSQTRQNLWFVLFLVFLAACFGIWIGYDEGRQIGLEFAAGYLIELSMSIDNLFVFLIMFRSFGLNGEDQRKALLFGIIGAILMRGIFIFAGLELLEEFHWIQYVFGGLLVITALRLLFNKKHGDTPASAKWITDLTARLTGGRGNTRRTTFIVVIIAIELVDLVFAIDSVPAVLAVSHHPFVVYTSNICAILGLRALYFLLAGLLDRLRYLHLGLAAILGFVGSKMMLAKFVSVPVAYSLGFIVLVIVASTAASFLIKHQREAA